LFRFIDQSIRWSTVGFGLCDVLQINSFLKNIAYRTEASLG